MASHIKQAENPYNIDGDINSIIKYFYHSFSSRVQFADVDSACVAHNIRYLYWLENARTDYFRDLGIQMNKDTFIKDFPVMVVHNEIDLLNSIHFNDMFQIYSKITYVGKSSLKFNNLIISDGKLIAKANATFVYIDPIQQRPTRIPDKFRKIIKDFEGDTVTFSEQ